MLSQMFQSLVRIKIIITANNSKPVFTEIPGTFIYIPRHLLAKLVRTVTGTNNHWDYSNVIWHEQARKPQFTSDVFYYKTNSILSYDYNCMLK